MRIWSTGYDPDRIDELRRFAQERSAPMFRSLEGCLGFIYGVNDDEWTTTTFWTGQEAVAAAELADEYQSTVAAIISAGFLRGRQTTEIFEVEHWEPPS